MSVMRPRVTTRQRAFVERYGIDPGAVETCGVQEDGVTLIGDHRQHPWYGRRGQMWYRGGDFIHTLLPYPDPQIAAEGLAARDDDWAEYCGPTLHAQVEALRQSNHGVIR